MSEPIIEAKEHLNKIGFVVIRIYGEWRAQTMLKTHRFKTDSALMAFAVKEGWGSDLRDPQVTDPDV